jgi:hypothetical protein
VISRSYARVRELLCAARMRTSPSRALAVAAALAGCGYEPSSFSFVARPAEATRATIGCLDLAITPQSPLASAHAVLAYEFGNRCDHPAVIDLGTATVVGHDAAGQVHPLVPHDPDGEIRPAWLDGRSRGRERIAYPSGIALSDICVDAAGIVREVPARWLCVVAGEGAGS